MDCFKERFDKLLSKTLNVTVEEIASDKRFKEDYSLDSLDMIEMVIALEKEFSITIPDEAIEIMQTVDDAEKTVRTRVHNSKQ